MCMQPVAESRNGMRKEKVQRTPTPHWGCCMNRIKCKSQMTGEDAKMMRAAIGQSLNDAWGLCTATGQRRQSNVHGVGIGT